MRRAAFTIFVIVLGGTSGYGGATCAAREYTCLVTCSTAPGLEDHLQACDHTFDSWLKMERKAYKAQAWVDHCNERSAYIRSLSPRACADLEGVTVLLGSHDFVGRANACILLKAATKPLP